MVSIIVTTIICATVIGSLVLVRDHLTITVKHIATTEISESMVSYQKMLIEAQTIDEIKDNKEPQVTLDSVVSAISNIFEGDD